MINTTGQQHWPRSLVITTGRHHWPEPLATCSKHVDDDEDDNDNDYGDDENDHDDYVDDGGDGDGDGEDELTMHSNMCVHECALRAINLSSWPANCTATLAAPLSTSSGQHYEHHWPTALATTTGQHHWPASLARIPRNMF